MIMYSIVIPVFNAELYIRDMVHSVKAQTYKNWEVIIIDDGSTDKTGAICDELADDHIRVFHNENKGQIGARIDGILKASGEYTLVVDADDRLHADCLETINQVLEKHQYDCVSFPYSLFDEDMNYLYDTMPPQKTGEITQRDFLFWIIDTLNHPLYNKAVKTDIIKAGAVESIKDKVSINGDYALIIPIVSYTVDIFYLNNSLYDYRVFDNSISHNRTYKQVLDTDLVSKSVLDILKKHGFADRKFEKLVYIKYLNMIEWLMCEINSKRFIKMEEINQLHNSHFYQASCEFETKENLSIKQLLILRTIRKKGKINTFKANLFMKLLGVFF